jgi:hypothetical protein
MPRSYGEECRAYKFLLRYKKVQEIDPILRLKRNGRKMVEEARGDTFLV